MTKYLTEERFLVTSNDKDGRKNYAANYDRIFGKTEEPPVEAPSEDAIECKMRFYANYIPAGPVAVINDVEMPALGIGWDCPIHPGDEDDGYRTICVIDWEARTFCCEYTHNEDPIEHSFDDI